VQKDHNDKGKSTSSVAAATDASTEDIESWAALVAEEDLQEWDEKPWIFAKEDYSSNNDLYEARTEDSEDQAASASKAGDTEAELYDSGASSHITPFRHHFLTYHSITPRPITAVDKHVFYAVGAGDLQIQVPNGMTMTPIILRDALHTPDIGVTVVSIGRIAKAGFSVLFEGSRCKIMDKNQMIIGDIQSAIMGFTKSYMLGRQLLSKSTFSLCIGDLATFLSMPSILSFAKMSWQDFSY
jgi:hypothetical protein